MTNHGTFTVYVPATPVRPSEPTRPTAPAALTASPTPEQIAARQAALTAYQSDMHVYTAAHAAWATAAAAADRRKAMTDGKAMFARREDGTDWYDLTATLPDGRTYCIAIGGRVCSVSTDAQQFGIQNGMTLIETTDPVEAGWSWNGSALAPPGLVSIKRDYARRVDRDAENERLKHMSPGAAMSLTYREKFEQAAAINRLDEAPANALTETQRRAQYPTLSASVGVEAETLWGVAQLVLTRYAAFAQLSYTIERARLSGKKAISDASNAAEVRAAYEAITWTTP